MYVSNSTLRALSIPLFPRPKRIWVNFWSILKKLGYYCNENDEFVWYQKIKITELLRQTRLHLFQYSSTGLNRTNGSIFVLTTALPAKRAQAAAAVLNDESQTIGSSWSTISLHIILCNRIRTFEQIATKNTAKQIQNTVKWTRSKHKNKRAKEEMNDISTLDSVLISATIIINDWQCMA